MPNRRERRKRKRDQQKKKSRFVGLQFSLDDVPKEELENLKIGVRFNGKGFEAIIRTDRRDISTDSVKGYRRVSKPGFNLKKTNFITNTRQMEILPNLDSFDTIMAIDTNSYSIQKFDFTSHVGVAAQVLTTIENGQPIKHAKIIKVFTNNGKLEKPENYNWKNLIEFIREHRNYLVTKKYGIIVDSDLGNIPNYNSRKAPIIDDFYLPQNFQLIYASSDAANDEITNQVIAFCDKISKKMLDQISADIEKEFGSNQ